MLLHEEDLRGLNARFAAAAPLEVLRFAKDVFGAKIAILSSMQRAGTVLCHLADRAGLAFDVLFVDTGVLHRETLATRDELARTHPNLDVVTLAPDKTFAAQTAERGVLYLTKEGQEECCHLRKTAPLLATKGRYGALVGALRKGEGGARAKVEAFGVDPAMNALRVHPLANVAEDFFDRYLEAHADVIQNPLHSMGFPTIGCFPCTTPVRPDEPERAGRWRHLAGVEYCGINPVDRGAKGGVEIDDHVAARLVAS